MCLAIPGIIEELEGEWAKVRVGGVTVEANVALVPGAALGDYVLVHAGYAIQRLTQEDAEESLELLREFSEFQESLDEGK
ncbi:HypC/HybG/HupF family hydrogenase formation chaperone [bacterium]|nr:HypC/HybG/HupF family hydrogenase formation chaperone [bacterium]